MRSTCSSPATASPCCARRPSTPATASGPAACAASGAWRDVDVRVEDVGRVDALLDLAQAGEDRARIGGSRSIGRLVGGRVVHVRAADAEGLHPAGEPADPANLDLVVLGPF